MNAKPISFTINNSVVRSNYKVTSEEASVLDMVSYYHLIKDENDAVVNIVSNALGGSGSIKERKDYINNYISVSKANNSCLNNVTPSGLPVKKVPFIVTDGTGQSNYCFDLSWIVHQMEQNNFVNPYTNEFYSEDCVDQVEKAVNQLLRSGNQFGSVSQTVQMAKLQEIKLRVLLRSINLPEEKIEESIQRFFSLTVPQLNQIAYSQFSSQVLHQINYKQFTPQERQRFILDKLLIDTSQQLTDYERGRLKYKGTFSLFVA